MAVEELIISFSYAAIFFFMIINGICGFPSSQLIYVLSGFFASTGRISLLLALFLGSTGNTIGNFILYEVSRRKGIDFFKRIKLIPLNEIKKVDALFRKKGIWFLFVGKLVNPIKIFISIPAGFSKMKRAIFLPIAFVTSLIWAIAFTSFGYYLGRNIENFSIIGVTFLIVAAIVMYIFYKMMNSSEIVKEAKKIKL